MYASCTNEIKTRDMNTYRNTFGYHTPKFSEKLFNRINKNTSVEWVDSSWHNDACDSIEHHVVEGYMWIRIALPNSVVQDSDNEEFNSFWVTDENNDELLSTENIYEVIDFINAVTK